MEGSINTDEIFILNFERARQKEKVDPGNWQLTISGSSGTENKGGLRTFIDDSGATTNPTINEAGRVFNIVSGSISSGIKTAAASETGGGVGLFYPDQGVLIFNAGQFRAGNGMDIDIRTEALLVVSVLVQILTMIIHLRFFSYCNKCIRSSRKWIPSKK